MAIDNSKNWNDYDDVDGEERVTNPVRDNQDVSFSYISKEEYTDEKPPIWDKNLFLDKEMYTKYINGDKLKCWSSTSSKEDKVFIKLALIFIVTLVIICALEVSTNYAKGTELDSWGFMRYLSAMVITFVASKFLNKKSEDN